MTDMVQASAKHARAARQQELRKGEGRLTGPSFRGDAKHRTRNLEIPRCASAHLRSGAPHHPGMTALDGLLRRSAPRNDGIHTQPYSPRYALRTSGLVLM